MSERSPSAPTLPVTPVPVSAGPAVVAAGLASLVLCLLGLGLAHLWWPADDAGNALIRELFTALFCGLSITSACTWAARRVGLRSAHFASDATLQAGAAPIVASPFAAPAAVAKPAAVASARPSEPADSSVELWDDPGEAPAATANTANTAHLRTSSEATAAVSPAPSSQIEQSRTLAILNATPDVIVGLNADGRIALCNPALGSVFGFTTEEVMGQPIRHLVPSLDDEAVERLTREGMFIRSTNAHVARLEANARRHDGTEFPAEVSVARVETEHGALYALVLRDLTEQRMANEMLGLYNRALECATNAMVISDMRLPNQPVFYANPAFERITGYSLMETIGQNLKMLQGQDDAQPEMAVLERAQRAGDSASVVIRSYRKDGSLFFNEVSIAPVKAEDGSVPHYVGVMSDVTERERSRMALAERNARLNAVFDLSPDGFVVFDREGELVYSNAAFREMTGWRTETTAQMTISEFDAAFAPMCDPVLPYRSVAQSLTEFNGAVATPEVIRLVQPSHRALARLVRHNVDGRGESILYLRDVTQETEVDRMKTEFLSTAAHELRTPMVSIFGFTELLLNRPVPDGKKRDLLETIHRQSSILINMVNELLDLARIEARAGKDMKRQALQIGPMIEQTVAAIMVSGDHRKVVVDMTHGEVELNVDREKTMQALTNILSNAYKYSPAGGEIRLSTITGRLREQPALGIRVQDQGIGMTAAQQARVFERFYRADPSGNIPGTGLGMSLVKEIAELQGGQVEIQSEFGKGTAVTLWFPMAPAIAAAPGASRAPSQ